MVPVLDTNHYHISNLVVSNKRLLSYCSLRTLKLNKLQKNNKITKIQKYVFVLFLLFLSFFIGKAHVWLF